MAVATILIFGASSAIAASVAQQYASDGVAFYLIARDIEKLKSIEADLLSRGAQNVRSATANLADTSTHQQLIESAFSSLGKIDLVLLAHGTLPDQKLCQEQYLVTNEALQVNFLSSISILTLLSNKLEQQGSGTLAVITSVAGDRGRQSNYIYGAAKGGLNIFLQGLRNRLFRKGVHVLTIKPGFVDTPMTAHLKKGPLFASPERVALEIKSAVTKGKNVVYAPWFWRWIMLIICLIPEAVFKRLKL